MKNGNPLTITERILLCLKKEKPICLSELEPEEKLKYEIAEELGLLDKVLEDGWKALSSKETGRIGGLITKKRREMEKAKE
ncbi:MAG: small, acid-soluble spore protein, alpha/beta type [[Clostridium] nexile]